MARFGRSTPPPPRYGSRPREHGDDFAGPYAIDVMADLRGEAQASIGVRMSVARAVGSANLSIAATAAEAYLPGADVIGVPCATFRFVKIIYRKSVTDWLGIVSLSYSTVDRGTFNASEWTRILDMPGNGQSVTVDSGWWGLPPAAQIDPCFFAVTTRNGDGATNLNFGNIRLLFG